MLQTNIQLNDDQKENLFFLVLEDFFLHENLDMVFSLRNIFSCSIIALGQAGVPVQIEYKITYGNKTVHRIFSEDLEVIKDITKISGRVLSNFLNSIIINEDNISLSDAQKLGLIGNVDRVNEDLVKLIQNLPNSVEVSPLTQNYIKAQLEKNFNQDPVKPGLKIFFNGVFNVQRNDDYWIPETFWRI